MIEQFVQIIILKYYRYFDSYRDYGFSVRNFLIRPRFLSGFICIFSLYNFYYLQQIIKIINAAFCLNKCTSAKHFCFSTQGDDSYLVVFFFQSNYRFCDSPLIFSSQLFKCYSRICCFCFCKK